MYNRYEFSWNYEMKFKMMFGMIEFLRLDLFSMMNLRVLNLE